MNPCGSVVIYATTPNFSKTHFSGALLVFSSWVFVVFQDNGAFADRKAHRLGNWALGGMRVWYRDNTVAV